MLMFQKSTNRPCPQDKSPIKVPTLNFGRIKQDEQYEEGEEEYEEPQQPQHQPIQKPKMPALKGKMPTMGGPGGNGSMGLNLDISKLKGQQDYQDEFMEAAKNFSESWREALLKDKRF
jgi:hypothetical protein